MVSERDRVDDAVTEQRLAVDPAIHGPRPRQRRARLTTPKRTGIGSGSWVASTGSQRCPCRPEARTCRRSVRVPTSCPEPERSVVPIVNGDGSHRAGAPMRELTGDEVETNSTVMLAWPRARSVSIGRMTKIDRVMTDVPAVEDRRAAIISSFEDTRAGAFLCPRRRWRRRPWRCSPKFAHDDSLMSAEPSFGAGVEQPLDHVLGSRARPAGHMAPLLGCDGGRRSESYGVVDSGPRVANDAGARIDTFRMRRVRVSVQEHAVSRTLVAVDQPAGWSGQVVVYGARSPMYWSHSAWVRLRPASRHAAVPTSLGRGPK